MGLSVGEEIILSRLHQMQDGVGKIPTTSIQSINGHIHRAADLRSDEGSVVLEVGDLVANVQALGRKRGRGC